MEPVSAVRRAGRLALALWLVAVLAVVGVSVLVPARGVAVAGDTDTGVAVGDSRVDATAPSRAAGRPVAEPSLVCVHGPGDGIPFGWVPPGPPPVELVQAGGGHAAVMVARDAAHHTMAAVRAPPAWRSVP